LKVVTDEGRVLDATFSIERRTLSLIYESAGGKTGINARNRDYTPGLELLLKRLASLGAIVWDIRVDSEVTRHLDSDQQRVELSRYALPLALDQVRDLPDLKKDITTAARHPGARPGSSKGGSSRRLRFELELGAWAPNALEHRLSRKVD
jgi:hypothetical protein